MKEVILSPAAKSDLDRIWNYTDEKWGEEQAEKYIRQLWSDLAKIAEDLKSSTAVDEIRRGYRKGRSGSHVIFFKPFDDGIEIIRILHQSMDFERHLT